MTKSRFRTWKSRNSSTKCINSRISSRWKWGRNRARLKRKGLPYLKSKKRDWRTRNIKWSRCSCYGRREWRSSRKFTWKITIKSRLKTFTSSSNTQLWSRSSSNLKGRSRSRLKNTWEWRSKTRFYRTDSTWWQINSRMWPGSMGRSSISTFNRIDLVKYQYETESLKKMIFEHKLRMIAHFKTQPDSAKQLLDAIKISEFNI